MNKLALSLPGLDGKAANIANPGDMKFQSDTTIGSLITAGMEVVIPIVGLILFGYLVWGVADYILAQGQKEKLAKAKNKMTWTLIGFVIVLASFAGSEYIKDLFKPQQTNPDQLEDAWNKTQRDNRNPTIKRQGGDE